MLNQNYKYHSFQKIKINIISRTHSAMNRVRLFLYPKGGIKMSVFRVNKQSDFTIMSNYHLRDKNLSNKSKGLLSIMLSLPEEWDYSVDGLVYICKDGYDSIRYQIHELEKYGYITRERERNEKGQLKGCNYVVYEIPIGLDSHNPVNVEPTSENHTQENRRQINTNLSRTDKINTYSINNQSIYLDEIDKKEIEENVAEQIEADSLSYEYPKEKVKEIVSIMADVISSSAVTIKINGSYVRKEDVIYRFSQINDEHIRYVLDSMERSASNIKNIRSYIITSLYNAPVTIENYYSALVCKRQRGA